MTHGTSSLTLQNIEIVFCYQLDEDDANFKVRYQVVSLDLI